MLIQMAVMKFKEPLELRGVCIRPVKRVRMGKMQKGTKVLQHYGKGTTNAEQMLPILIRSRINEPSFSTLQNGLPVWSHFLIWFKRPWVMQSFIPALISEWSQGTVDGLSPRGDILWSSIFFVVSWGL